MAQPAQVLKMRFKINCDISPEGKLLEDCLAQRPSLPTENQQEFLSEENLYWKCHLICPANTPQVCPVLQSLGVCWELSWLCIIPGLCKVLPTPLLHIIANMFSNWLKKKKCPNGVSPMRKLWSGWGGKTPNSDFPAKSLDDFYSEKPCRAKVHMDQNHIQFLS